MRRQVHEGEDGLPRALGALLVDVELEEDVAPGGLRVPRQPLEMPARVALEEPLVCLALADAADAADLPSLRCRQLHRARHPCFLALPNPADHRIPLAEEVQDAVPVQLLDNMSHSHESKSTAKKQKRSFGVSCRPGAKKETFTWKSSRLVLAFKSSKRQEIARGTRPRSSKWRGPPVTAKVFPWPLLPKATKQQLSSRSTASSQGFRFADLVLAGQKGDMRRHAGGGRLEGGLGDFLEDPRLTRTARAEDPIEGEVPQQLLLALTV